MMDDLPTEILDTILEHGLDEEDRLTTFEEQKTLLNWTTKNQRSFLSVNRHWNKSVCHNTNMWRKIVLVAHRDQHPQRALEHLECCLSRRGRHKHIALRLQIPDEWCALLPQFEAAMQPYSLQIEILELNPTTQLHLDLSGLKHLIIQGSSSHRPCFTASPNLEIAHINAATYHGILLSSLHSICHLELSQVNDQMLLRIIQEAHNLESLSIDTVKVNRSVHKLFHHKLYTITDQRIHIYHPRICHLKISQIWQLSAFTIPSLHTLVCGKGIKAKDLPRDCLRPYKLQTVVIDFAGVEELAFMLIDQKYSLRSCRFRVNLRTFEGFAKSWQESNGLLPMVETVQILVTGHPHAATADPTQLWVPICHFFEGCHQFQEIMMRVHDIGDEYHPKHIPEYLHELSEMNIFYGDEKISDHGSY